MGSPDANRVPAENEDRRRHRRFPLSLSARFMLPDRSEHEATLLDMSAGGLSIKSELRPTLGNTIIVYVQDLGRLEGSLVRHHDQGFACAFSEAPSVQERIADKLTLLMNRLNQPNSEARIHPRLPTRELARLQMSDGSAYDVRILDMSFGGVSIATGVRPPIGAEVTVGRMKGRVVRHHEQGIAVAFDSVHASWGSLALSLR